MGTIASIDISVRAATSAFSSGLKKAKVEAAGFAKDVGDKLGSIPFAGIAAGLAGVGVGIGAGLAALTASGIDRIDELGDSAQRIGVTTEALSELRYAANLTGSSAEDLDAALEKLSANLGDSAAKSGPTADALARLGLDAKQLANGETDETFHKIVEGFEKIPNAAEKASLAMDIFGKGGVKILNTLGAGGKQLDELAAEARKLGVSVSQVDQAKVAAAKDALDRAGAAVEGLGNKLAVGLAPIITAAAEEFTSFFLAASEGGPTVEGVIDGIVAGLAKTADFIQGLGIAWQEVTNGITAGTGFVLEGLGKFQNALLSLIPGGKALKDSIMGDFEAIGADMRRQAGVNAADIQKQWAASTPGDAILAKYAAFKGKVQEAAEASAKAARDSLGSGNVFDSIGKSIEDVTKKLQEQVGAFGKSTAQAELYKLAQMGATSAQLQGVKALADQLDGLEKAKKSQEELATFAKSLKESTRSPAEKFLEEAGKIDKAVAAGLLTKAEGLRGKQSSAKESGLNGEGHFAGALQLGSAEARSAILAATSGRGNGVEEATRQVAANTRAATDYLAEIARSFSTPPETIRI